jgi:hypothetical protein
MAQPLLFVDGQRVGRMRGLDQKQLPGVDHLDAHLVTSSLGWDHDPSCPFYLPASRLNSTGFPFAAD